MKKIIFISIAILMAVALGGCADTSADKNSHKEAADKNHDLKPVYKAYLAYIEERENAITSFGENAGAKESEGQKECLALCDINEDSVPELFYFVAGEMPQQRVLRIATYKDGLVSDVGYTFSDTSGGTYKAGGLSFQDPAAGGPMLYAIYKSTERNRFIIYSNKVDDIAKVNINEYEMSLDGTMEELYALENDYGMAQDDEYDVYWFNGSTISKEDFYQRYHKALDRVDVVLMYQGYGGDMNTIWKKFKKEDSVGVTYEKMVKQLGD